MNLLLKSSTQSRVNGRYECKCCDPAYRSSKGVKSRRRAVKRRERRQWKANLSNM